MPKLPKNVAKKASDAEMSGGSYEPIPAGKYLARLTTVTSTPSNNYPDNVARWSAEFTDITDAEGNHYPGRLWFNLNVVFDDSMPGNYERGQSKWDQFVSISNGQLRAFFENMGYTTDSDTDEMAGEVAYLKVSIRTIQYGQRQGERTNQVDAILPMPDDLEDRASEMAAGSDAGDEYEDPAF